LRASTLEELLLETEPEWRLYEDLRAVGSRFEIQAGRVRLTDPGDPRGRAVFAVGHTRVQYQGAAGFLVRRAGQDDLYLKDASDLITVLMSKT
jgi:hypothetical protein